MEKDLNKVRELKHYKKALGLEKSILNKRYDLENELRIFDVEVRLNGIPTFIHSYVAGEKNAETLVLLHGFGGSGLTFYKMIKELAKRFRVFTLDFIGMGLSDRQDFKIVENATQVVNFFVNSIEQWRKVLGLQKFKLAGHSFGGYMAANYTAKYPENVIETFLLSPMAGTMVKPENDLSNEENFQAFAAKLPFLRRLAFKYIRCQSVNQKMTPGKLLRKWFIPENFILKKAVEKRLKITDKDESAMWKGFLKNSFKLPESTEKHIHDLITMPGAQARLSIEQVIKENPSKINVDFTIIFGDNDWMSTVGCKRLLDDNYLNGSLVIMTEAGHQLPFDQPENVAKVILESQKQVQLQI